MQLAIDVGLAYPPGNELAVLSAEIQNQDFLGVDIGGRRVAHFESIDGRWLQASIALGLVDHCAR